MSIAGIPPEGFDLDELRSQISRICSVPFIDLKSGKSFGPGIGVLQFDTPEDAYAALAAFSNGFVVCKASASSKKRSSSNSNKSSSASTLTDAAVTVDADDDDDDDAVATKTSTAVASRAWFDADVPPGSVRLGLGAFNTAGELAYTAQHTSDSKVRPSLQEPSSFASTAAIGRGSTSSTGASTGTAADPDPLKLCVGGELCNHTCVVIQTQHTPEVISLLLCPVASDTIYSARFKRYQTWLEQ